MLGRKDRKIKNQEVMIKNRDILIGDIEKREAIQKQAISVLTERLKRINKLATGNKYSNEKVIISKIIELSSDDQSIR